MVKACGYHAAADLMLMPVHDNVTQLLFVLCGKSMRLPVHDNVAQLLLALHGKRMGAALLL